MNELDQAIADIFADNAPGLAEEWRRIKAIGVSKSRCVELVTKLTGHKPLMRGGLLLMLDKVWAEPRRDPRRRIK